MFNQISDNELKQENQEYPWNWIIHGEKEIKIQCIIFKNFIQLLIHLY